MIHNNGLSQSNFNRRNVFLTPSFRSDIDIVSTSWEEDEAAYASAAQAPYCGIPIRSNSQDNGSDDSLYSIRYG